MKYTLLPKITQLPIQLSTTNLLLCAVSMFELKGHAPHSAHLLVNFCLNCYTTEKYVPLIGTYCSGTMNRSHNN